MRAALPISFYTSMWKTKQVDQLPSTFSLSLSDTANGHSGDLCLEIFTTFQSKGCRLSPSNPELSHFVTAESSFQSPGKHTSGGVYEACVSREVAKVGGQP